MASSDQEPAFTTVAYGYGLAETRVAVSFLEAHGITVTPAAIEHAGYAWQAVTALGGIELRVPTAQAELAARLLHSGAEPPPRRRSLLLRVVFQVAFWGAILWIGLYWPARGIVLCRPRGGFSEAEAVKIVS